MRYFQIILIVLLLFSCNNKESANINIDTKDILGNWYSIENNSYREYFFEEDFMYDYNVYSKDVFQYSYIIKQDSIFRYFKHPELKNQTYEYYNQILRIDSLRIIFKDITLNRLDDINTLGMFVKDEIDHKTLDKFGGHRENIAIPLDSLLDKIGNGSN